MTPPISKLVNLGSLIQQLLVTVGQTCHGLEAMSAISNSRNPLTNDITLTGLCVRSSDTDQTSEANQPPSLLKPSYPSESSKISNPNTCAHSLLIWNGQDGWTVS